ncbi:MAG: catalase [Acidimicrobiales bacterium]|nr:catalase [Acidimicrobiales bacterium]
MWTQGGEVPNATGSGPVDDSYNMVRIGEAGPAQNDELHRRGKITPFDHERIREPHAQGAAAHGTF